MDTFGYIAFHNQKVMSIKSFVSKRIGLGKHFISGRCLSYRILHIIFNDGWIQLKILIEVIKIFEWKGTVVEKESFDNHSGRLDLEFTRYPSFVL